MSGTWDCEGSTFTVSQDGCTGGTATKDVTFTVNNVMVTFTGQLFTGQTASVNTMKNELMFTDFNCKKEPGKNGSDIKFMI